MLIKSVSTIAVALTVITVSLDGYATSSSTQKVFRNHSAETIRPLLGVNGGPTPFQLKLNPQFINTTKQFQLLGVNAIRMVDYFGANDIMCMFPNPSADPSDDSNYKFESTDAVFQSIVDGNFRPMLRLGQSWKVGKVIRDYDVNAPTGAFFPEQPISYPGCIFWNEGLAAGVEKAGPALWKHIISRYSDSKLWGTNPLKNGWIEIWNEPNWPNTTEYWDDTPEKFYEFFATTAHALTADFPDLRIGGPGLASVSCTTPDGRKWVDGFFKYLNAHHVPLDFFSWHFYGSNIDQLRGCYLFYSNLLDQYGYGGTPQIVTEYNTDAIACAGVGKVCHPHGAFEGGALLATAWIEMQSWPDLEGFFVYRGADGPFIPNTEITMTLYLGDSGMGMLYGDGTLKPEGAAFSLMSMLAGMKSVGLAEPSLFVSKVDQAKLSNAGAKLAGGLPILGILAGRDQFGNVKLLVTNPQDVTVTVDIAGLLWTGHIKVKNNTMITVTSLTKNTANLISKSEVKFGSLNNIKLEPFSVQVYEIAI